MAHGWAIHFLGDRYTIFSAGTKKHGLNPFAVKVMAESGIDISRHTSNTIEELPDEAMDFVFTVCADAHENCPHFPGGKVIHVGFDDPPSLTEKMTGEGLKLEVYRRVRDEIEEFVKTMEKDHL